MVTTSSLSFGAKKLEFFSQNAWVFSPEPLSFFQSTGILKIWSQIFGKMAVFCRKFAQKVPNIAFFWRASRKFAQFWLIYSKNAENGMSFEIHLATITTGSLSFGLKNPWVFWKVEFFRAWVFSKMLKKSLSYSPISYKPDWVYFLVTVRIHKILYLISDRAPQLYWDSPVKMLSSWRRICTMGDESRRTDSSWTSGSIQKQIQIRRVRTCWQLVQLVFQCHISRSLHQTVEPKSVALYLWSLRLLSTYRKKQTFYSEIETDWAQSLSKATLKFQNMAGKQA